MNGSLRAELEQLIAAMSPRDRRRLAQRAERDRREAVQKLRRARGRRGFRGPGPQPDDPVQEWMLHRLAAEREAPVKAAAREREGEVVSLSRRWAHVRPVDSEETLLVGLPIDLARQQRAQIAVGDRVSFGELEGGRMEVGEVHTRRSNLSRPDPADPLSRQVLVANVDLVLIVIAAKDPEPRSGLIDRMLVGVARGGARAALVVNKLDLCDAETRAALDDLLAPYRELGLEIIELTATTGDGLDGLRAAMRGHCCVLTGHSGVGKSTLVNALVPNAEQRVGEVNEVVGKGRHTTSRSQLFHLPDDTRLIDTPGVRAFGLWEVAPLEAQSFFPDLATHGARCRYRDCLHVDEDLSECAVQQAVEDGALAAARYQGYRRIVAALREDF
ncbi:MAG: ribosome small subunit-dependent GTPase A [Alphaproteobacteria bacterium]|nr:ribosome small subunit-dependent GTPase A [Alphaproteobacteria bacterium]